MPYSRLVSQKIGEQDDKAIWMLTEPLLWENGIYKIIVPVGFQCDFASVPRLPFAFMVCGDTAHEAGTVHDYLYRSDSVPPVDRETADYIFYIIMGEMGINYFKRYAMWKAVSLFAGRHWHKRKVLDEFMEGYKW